MLRGREGEREDIGKTEKGRELVIESKNGLTVKAAVRRVGCFEGTVECFKESKRVGNK